MFENKSNRAPFQVLVFPFFKNKQSGTILYAIFRRSDLNFWQGISGGGENDETLLEAARREIQEETDLQTSDADFTRLSSIATIPCDYIKGQIWGEVIMIPEFSFGLKTNSKKLSLSSEHSEYLWLEIDDAIEKLKYDSNKSALWELDRRLKNINTGGIKENVEIIQKFL